MEKEKILSTKPSIKAPHSAWSPFRHEAFTVIWTATVVSNIGAWMYSAAAGWLMTSLNPSPFVVSMVQVASTLPYFLFALAAGALADAANRRKILLIGDLASTIFAAGFVALVVLHLVSTLNLLLFVFLIEAATAVTSPAWQSIVPPMIRIS